MSSKPIWAVVLVSAQVHLLMFYLDDLVLIKMGYTNHFLFLYLRESACVQYVFLFLTEIRYPSVQHIYSNSVFLMNHFVY